MSNLRQRVFDEINLIEISYTRLEEQLMFQKGDIAKFIYSDWKNLDKSFSPFALCMYLHIPVEEYHKGYFIDFNGKENYIQYMNEYKKREH